MRINQNYLHHSSVLIITVIISMCDFYEDSIFVKKFDSLKLKRQFHLPIGNGLDYENIMDM